MYFSLYDNQLDSLRAFCLNMNTRKSAREALVNFLSLGNFSDEGLESINRNSLNELCNYYEFTLVTTKHKISESTNFRKIVTKQSIRESIK